MKKKKAKILWLTGLSGAGKTTLANQTYKKLNKYNFKLLKIDADIFRKKTKNKNNFTKKNIIFKNNRIILYVKRLEKKFDFIIKTPPASFLIKEAAKLKGGSKEPGIVITGTITKKQAEQIAIQKMKDLNAHDLEQATKIICGSARSMGIEVKG